MVEETPRGDERAWPLFEAYPQLVGRLPRVRIGEWPTPVESLTLPTPAARTIWVKRDDVSGPKYGGNKVRKLEAVLADAVRTGHSEVWTCGAMGSHHCLATAIYARDLGLRTQVMHFPQPVTEHVRKNIRAIVSTGAELTMGWRNALPVEIARQKLRSWLSGSGEGAYYIPAGGSSPLGAIGYVNAAFELADQVRAGEVPEPDKIYVPAGTNGTFVGLWLGCALAGLRSEVVAVRVVDRIICCGPVVKHLLGKLVKALGDYGVAVPDAAIDRPMRLVHDQFGKEYGRPTEAALRAVRTMREAGGPPLEFTYTGKAFAGLLADLRSTGPETKVLFWDTFNSRPLDDLVEATPPSAVPEAYAPYFEGPVEIAE